MGTPWQFVTVVLSALYSTVLFTLGFFGIYAVLKNESQNHSKALWLLGTLIMMPLSVAGIIVETRYRFLVYPFLALFAGHGLSLLMQKKIPWKPALFAIALLLGNTFFDMVRNADRIIERINTLL